MQALLRFAMREPDRSPAITNESNVAGVGSDLRIANTRTAGLPIGGYLS